MGRRTYALLVNPAAGGGRAAAVLPAVWTELDRLGVAATEHRTTSLEHGRELALAAAGRGEAVAVLSGDGLLGAVAGALADVPGAVLGILPGGRGNDVARACGIPRDPVAACAVLATGRTAPLDLGMAVGADGARRVFVSIAYVGLDAEANRVANGAPAALGRLAYVYGALRALIVWRPARFEVDVDGASRGMHGWSVAVANTSAYGGGMQLAPDARPDDGALDVVLVSGRSRLRVLRALPLVFSGRHVTLPEVEVLRGRRIAMRADRPLSVYADGDPLCSLPATISVLPAAVAVLLPA